MQAAILIDFGSTYTKLVVVSLTDSCILLSTKYPSTVKEDARIVLEQCKTLSKRLLGQNNYNAAIKLASSSAAGGLRMAVIGLSKSLSVLAGKNAASGAGAKILSILSGPITKEQIENLENLNCEIILFCGGYENGNKSIMLHNADMLANSSIMAPFIYAGNSSVAEQIHLMFTVNNKECYIVPNIIPNVNQICSYSAEELIRDIFVKRIVNMKGLSHIASYIDQIVMPTPTAVRLAGELLSKGYQDEKGIGDTLLVDIGGATTDVHSFCESISYEGLKKVGAVEPYAKRTVEGDLGMRESSVFLMQELGYDETSSLLHIPEYQIKQSINRRIKQTSFIANNKYEKQLDQLLAGGAVYIAARRHAGKIVQKASGGFHKFQEGKNISNIKNIIGTGGAIIHSCNPYEIVSKIVKTTDETNILLPQNDNIKFYIDKEYVFFAAGLLQKDYPKEALQIMKKSLTQIGV